MLEFCIEDRLATFEERLEMDIVLALIEDVTKEDAVNVLVAIEDAVNDCDSCKDRDIILDVVKEDVFIELYSMVEPVSVDVPSMDVIIEDAVKEDTNVLPATTVLATKVDALREDIFAIFVVIVEPTSEDMLIELTVSVDPVIEDTHS